MLGLASILLLGIGAQWLAWRMRLPSILLLLLGGFAAGPFTGHRLVDPDELLGESLLPFVSLAVAIILFEGGLTLRFRELREARKAVFNLIFFGAPLTLVLGTVAARWTLGLDWRVASLIGAIVVVTGPTVIMPLLRHIRPTGAAGSVVRWEGIVTDPIGAIMAVLLFQALLLGDQTEGSTVLGWLGAVLAAGAIGIAAAIALVLLLKRGLIPDFLHSSVTLAFVLTAFVSADQLQHESGLLAVTLMGIAIANQRNVAVEHIVEFKENLSVLLISTLFILLAARLPIEEFMRFDWRALAFVVVLILVVRPLMVLLATLGSGLSWSEKAFVAWMAPRGIVAAAVASVFQLEMEAAGVEGAERMVPVIFLVIIMTVLVYGLSAGPVARRLGLARKGLPQGVLFVGAHSWARELAKSLRGLGLDVLMADTNHHEIQAARMEGLPAYYGSALSEDFEHHAPLDGIGRLLCMTHNDEVNSLVCLDFSSSLGRHNIFQLVPDDDEPGGDELPLHLRGHALFEEGCTYWTLESRFRGGAIVKRTRFGEGFGLEEFRAKYDQPGAPIIPLFVYSAEGKLTVVNADEDLEAQPGDTLVAIVDAPDEDAPDENAPATSSSA